MGAFLFGRHGVRGFSVYEREKFRHREVDVAVRHLPRRLDGQKLTVWVAGRDVGRVTVFSGSAMGVFYRGVPFVHLGNTCVITLGHHHVEVIAIGFYRPLRHR